MAPSARNTGPVSTTTGGTTGTVPAPPTTRPSTALVPMSESASARVAAPETRRFQNTPGRLRLFAIVVTALIALAGLAAFALASQLTSNTDRIDDSTGPVLISTQQMLASLAEADAAATSVFRSGLNEDREQRQLYIDALQRATAEHEEVARLVGDDPPSHEALQRISSLLVTYSGVIENARLANRQGLPSADAQLSSAISIVRDGITPEVERITTRAQDRLEVESNNDQFVLAIAALLLAALIVLIALVYLARRFRRLLNLPLVASLIVLVVLAGWLAFSFGSQRTALSDARTQGYESIRLTAEVQSNAFRYKANDATETFSDAEALALASGDIVDGDIENARSGVGMAKSGLLPDLVIAADSARERAAVAEVAERWQRYLDTSRDLRAAAAANDVDTVNAIATGRGTSAFNGFNTAVESVLVQNQKQFVDAVNEADDLLKYVRLAIPIATLIAALLAWWGFSLRIRDYQ